MQDYVMFWVSYAQIAYSDKDILRVVAKDAGYLRAKWSGCHLVFGMDVHSYWREE